jgi:translation initiation factor 3 subunit C
MLLEIPAMAAAGSSPDTRKKVISKPFRRMLDYNSRQVFSGPPENTRDHIMGAAKALASGEWQKSTELINAIKIWELMPAADKIKEMLGRKIQEEGLRTYLFANAS